MDVTSAAIATLISSAVATTVALLINRANAIKSLHDRLDGILKIAIQYPYLESSRFTATWNENKNSDDEKYLRYENYCILVFNYLEILCKHHGHDKQKIENHINIKEWARNHRDYWLNPPGIYENADGYSEKFKKLIESYLK